MGEKGMALGFGILGLAVYGIIVALIWILTVMAKWKVFTKAGIAGWKSIIPIYAHYLTFRIAWHRRYFWYLIGFSLLTQLLRLFSDGSTGASGIIYSILTVVCAVTVLYVVYKLQLMLARRFGHGVLFALGLILFNTIFTLILGLGSDRYQGNPEEGLPPQFL